MACCLNLQKIGKLSNECVFLDEKTNLFYKNTQKNNAQLNESFIVL